ncbi:MAG: aminopeptidase [Lachnospiraceae bacterium]|nr:aminopeptidase [Lachnospiraceae bacterium]
MDKERYELSTERIREICGEKQLEEPYYSYFSAVADFLLCVTSVYEGLENFELCKPNSLDLKAVNSELFRDIIGENYEKSYANPEFTLKIAIDNGCNQKLWQMLCFLYTELRGLIPYAFEGDLETLVRYLELFIEVYCSFCYSLTSGEAVLEKEVFEAIYWFERDNLDYFLKKRLVDKLDPGRDFALRLIMEADLSNPDYLYRFGEYITENERRTAEFLNTLPEKEIKAMAATYTEGYRIGFLKAGKPLNKKKTVNIRYNLGFERLVREAVKQFEAMGLAPVIYRAASLSSDIGTERGGRLGYFGAIPNRQCDYDHREDIALYWDREYQRRRLDLQKRVYEENKELANTHAGPAVIEVFGETPFSPVSKDNALRLSESQRKLMVSYREKSGRLTNQYIIGEERSFTIISYPIPEIGKDYEAIFRETVRLNTLDYKLYEGIQQKLIDALDEGEEVRILGTNGNETDLTVALHRLADPDRETIFENCVADVNIPVGEVFTSPVLKGTNGLLNVTSVYLNGLKYIDLRLRFTDGLITEYSCKNYEDEAANRRYIEENLLFSHKTLPLGEFAIGTNTTAYRMSRDYDIGERLPILIGEKTGPHFAVGDTCYSHEEDIRVYNPDGKEIVAKSNEISELRTSDPKKAYFYCHTDITIPYDELKGIYVVSGEKKTPIIENGLFVLPGTEELNVPLLK